MNPTQLPQMPSMERTPAMPQMEVAPSGNIGSNAADGRKRELLQRLISNLLNKPGRSVNELINGVKAAIGAYKNYAKEWDTLNGIRPEGGATASGASNGGSSSDVQKILQEIQQKKASQSPQTGTGGPGYMMSAPPMQQQNRY